MQFDFTALRSLMKEWPTTSIPECNYHDSVLDRVCQVLRLAHTNTSPSEWHADFIPLIRHCLLAESYRTGQMAELRVPNGSFWPTRDRWESHGISAMSAGVDANILTANKWLPDWLGANQNDVFHDAFTDIQVRAHGQCDADPFIRDATGFDYYSSPGQREAVRAVFLMQEGETLLVNLPTGSGKSLVGQAPALVNKPEGGLTVFVVPTVALALDQERAMGNYIRKNENVRAIWPLAWYGGQPQEQRAEIRTRIRNGTQRILFTSPEALTTTLLSAVSEAAKSGMLKYLVVDEAHLITQWGDSFRPSFQALAGLRHNLLKLSPRGFRTLLLSATFTQETIETLANLFGPINKTHMIAAVHLRPEPQYWFAFSSDNSEKQERVIQALMHAPRPFILYVTTRKEIHEWRNILRCRMGLRRITSFDGGTESGERAQIINDWVNNKIDGIVATSAFGVGIDKSDVRSIIHATIPETLDRYYQEVGRGGRDGRPSISLVVYEKEDWNLPERLARPQLVTEEMGLSRWKAMYKSKKEIEGNDLIDIDIDAVREGKKGGNEYNIDWNMRTLILMARANLIELDVMATDQSEEEVDDDETESLRVTKSKIRIKIKNEGHLREDIWENYVTTSRNNTLTSALRNLGLMKRLLNNKQEVSEILADLYRVNTTDWVVPVTRVCGGCPGDRISSLLDRTYSMPIALSIATTQSVNFQVWRQRISWVDPTLAYVFFDDTKPINENLQLFVRFVGWLVHECGVKELSTSENSLLKEMPAWQGLYKRASGGFLLNRDFNELQNEPYTPTPRVTVLETNPSASLLERVQMLQRPYHIIILPQSMPDPTNELRRLADVYQNSSYLNQLLPVISQ